MCAAPIDERDARHISLAGFGAAAVERLHAASALLIGVGGTGCAAASALTAAGIGRLVLSDFDRVEASNLARQSLFAVADLHQPKVSAAAAHLGRQNPAVRIDTVDARLSGPALAEAVAGADVVLDCSDNFASRFALNRACVAANKTLVSGSAIRWEGQIAVFGPDYANSACYRCLYKDDDESLDDCSGSGVLGPLPAVIGSLMATEAIKRITGIGNVAGLTIYDALSGDWRQLNLRKRCDCPVCSPSAVPQR